MHTLSAGAGRYALTAWSSGFPSNGTVECRHFAKRGACLYGDACRFAHSQTAAPSDRDAVNPVERELAAAFFACEQRLNALRAENAPQAMLLDTVAELKRHRVAWNASRQPRPSRYARRRNLKNDESAGIFRRFLLRTFGPDVLRGSVLDVAGGSGTLGFELANLHGADVITVDPRPANFGRSVRKWAKAGRFATSSFSSEPCAPAHTAPADTQDAAASLSALRAIESRHVHREWREAAERTRFRAWK